MSESSIFTRKKGRGGSGVGLVICFRFLASFGAARHLILFPVSCCALAQPVIRKSENLRVTASRCAGLPAFQFFSSIPISSAAAVLAGFIVRRPILGSACS